MASDTDLTISGTGGACIVANTWLEYMYKNIIVHRYYTKSAIVWHMFYLFAVFMINLCLPSVAIISNSNYSVQWNTAFMKLHTASAISVLLNWVRKVSKARQLQHVSAYLNNVLVKKKSLTWHESWSDDNPWLNTSASLNFYYLKRRWNAGCNTVEVTYNVKYFVLSPRI